MFKAIRTKIKQDFKGLVYQLQHFDCKILKLNLILTQEKVSYN